MRAGKASREPGGATLRILIHDHAGHAFPAELSRELARRGHTVLHVYSESFNCPKGPLTRTDRDPSTFDVRGIRLRRPFDKYSVTRRPMQEHEFARLFARETGFFEADVIVSGTSPLAVQAAVLKICRRRGAGSVFWLQDIVGIAIRNILSRKIRMVGRLAGVLCSTIERRLLRSSEAVVAISDDFREILLGYGVDSSRIHVIPNWAPVESIPLRPKDNEWSRAERLAGKFCFVYAGTLGMKHDPGVLLKLATHFREDPSVRIVTVAEGPGAAWLQHRTRAVGLENVVMYPYQPFGMVPDVLATADVLVCILRQDCSTFSVPSKILAYMCAGRPVLASVPRENLAARIVAGHAAGVVVPPSDNGAFLVEAGSLVRDAERRRRMGTAGRNYAEGHFGIGAIADRFEGVLASAASAVGRGGAHS